MKARNANPSKAGLERVIGLWRWRAGPRSAGAGSGCGSDTLGMGAPYPVWGLDAYRSRLNLLTHQKKNRRIYLRFFIFESGRQDLNLRPSGPKPETPKNQVLLPTALATRSRIVAAHWPLLLDTIRQNLTQTTPVKIPV